MEKDKEYADFKAQLEAAQEELKRKDEAFNRLGVKFDKEVERWQERDADELEKRRILQAELSRVKEVAEKMSKSMENILNPNVDLGEGIDLLREVLTEFANLMNKEK